MELKRLMIPIVVTAFIIMLIPAAMAAGGTITGKVAFPANMTLTADINKSIDVTALTIYAMNTNTNFVNTTNPGPDGTYSVRVPEDGKYRIFISPPEVIDVSDYENPKLAQYPDNGARLYLIMVSGDTSNVDIDYFAPGEYVPPNNLTIGTPTPIQPNVTPRPASGFAIVLALIGLAGAFAIVSRRK